MATLDLTSAFTLVEIAKRTWGNEVLPLANALVQRNDIVRDALWFEANGPTHHIYSKVIALPSGTWRILNSGVDKKVGQTRQVDERIALLEGASEIDEAALLMSPDPLMIRSQEDLLFLEGMGQQFAQALFYGNQWKSNSGAPTHMTEPEKLVGLGARYYNSSSHSNVQLAGGSGADLTSIWIVEWSPNGVFLAYPRGAKTTGVERVDNGRQRLLDSNSKPFWGYCTQFKINAALCVKDDRAVQRIANIETAGSTSIFDPDLLIKALNKMPSMGEGATIYCNRTIKSQIDINAKDKSNVFYTAQDPYGRSITYFRGVPVHLCEQLIDTEEAIS